MSAHTGRTYLEMLWDGMDAKTDRLMEMEEVNQAGVQGGYEDGMLREAAIEYAEETVTYLTERGKALGLAYAIALVEHMNTPVADGIALVSEEAMARWEARNPDDEPG